MRAMDTRMLSRFVPNLLKPILRPVYESAALTSRRLTHRPKSRDELHEYWRRPPDPGNTPADYLEGTARSVWLVELVKAHAGPSATEATVLEIGCNVGRNLNEFHRAGFRHLSGIEINADAIKLLRERFPELGKAAEIHCGPVEEAIKTYSDGQFDVVYTMAVLEHIHSESEWVFAEIVRVTRRFLITVEDERGVSDRHFPRRYDKIFKALGMTEIESQPCTGLEGLGAGFCARVFRKADTA